jgi:hypothetical protein
MLLMDSLGYVLYNLEATRRRWWLLAPVLRRSTSTRLCRLWTMQRGRWISETSQWCRWIKRTKPSNRYKAKSMSWRRRIFICESSIRGLIKDYPSNCQSLLSKISWRHPSLKWAIAPSSYLSTKKSIAPRVSPPLRGWLVKAQPTQVWANKKRELANAQTKGIIRIELQETHGDQ